MRSGCGGSNSSSRGFGWDEQEAEGVDEQREGQVQGCKGRIRLSR